VSNKWCILYEDFREGVEPRLRGDCSRALKKEDSGEALWYTLFERTIVENY